MLERYEGLARREPGNRFVTDRYFALRRARDGGSERLAAELSERASALQATAGDWVLLAAFFSSTQNDVRAIEALRQARSLSPNDASVRASLGNALRRANDPGAEAELEAALGLERDALRREEISRALGEMAIDRRDLALARRRYEAFVPDRGAAFLSAEFARALEARGLFSEASDEYVRLSSRVRADVRAWLPIARDAASALLRAERFPDAEALLTEAIRAARDGGIASELRELRTELARRTGTLAAYADGLRERTDAPSRRLLAAIDEELGHDERAIEGYRRVLASAPRDVDTRQRLLRALARTGRVEEMDTEYVALLRAAPRELRFAVEYASFLMERGRRDDALRAVESTERAARRDPGTLRGLAELLSRWGEYERAAAIAQGVARVDAGDARTLVELGSRRLQAGDLAGAEEAWRRVFAVEPDQARAHRIVGDVYLANGRAAEAVREFQAALSANASDLEAQRGLGLALEAQQRWPEAVSVWEAARRRANEEDRAEVRDEAELHLIGLWRRTGQLDGLVRGWQRAFFAEPADVEAGRMLVQVMPRLVPPRPAEVVTVLTRLASLESPPRAEHLVMLEQAQRSAGDRRAAMATLERLVEIDAARSADHLVALADLSLALYDDAGALSYLERARRTRPDDVHVLRRAAALHRSLGHAAEALDLAVRALEIDSHDDATRWLVGELLAASGRAADATAVLADAAKLSRDDAFVLRAVRRASETAAAAQSFEVAERAVFEAFLANPTRGVLRYALLELDRNWWRASSDRSALRERLASRALKAMIEGLRDTNPSVRSLAFELLDTLRPEAAFGPLVAFARETTTTPLAKRAGEIALRCASRADVGVVTELARNGGVAFTKPSAHWLAMLAAEGGLSPADATAVREALRTLSSHPDVAIRAQASFALGFVDTPGVRDYLADRMRDTSSDVRAAALAAMVQRDGEGAWATLLSARTERPDVADIALAGLASIDHPNALSALSEALFVARWSTFARAAFEEVQAPTPGEVVEALASGRRDHGRASLLQWVRAQTKLADVPESERSLARMAAASEAMARGEHAVVVSLLAAEASSCAESDMRCAREMARFVAEHHEPIADLAGGRDATVRFAALTLFARYGGERAAPSLDAALASDDPETRRKVLGLLSRGHEHLVARVRTIAEHDPRWTMRLDSVAALSRIGGVAALHALAHVAHYEPYDLVREAAVRALGNAGSAAASAP